MHTHTYIYIYIYVCVCVCVHFFLFFTFAVLFYFFSFCHFAFFSLVVRLSNIFILRFTVALPLTFPRVSMIIFRSYYLTEGAHSL